jgi:hypothetical protein
VGAQSGCQWQAASAAADDSTPRSRCHCRSDWPGTNAIAGNSPGPGRAPITGTVYYAVMSRPGRRRAQPEHFPSGPPGRRGFAAGPRAESSDSAALIIICKPVTTLARAFPSHVIAWRESRAVGPRAAQPVAGRRRRRGSSVICSSSFLLALRLLAGFSGSSG